MNSKTLSNSFRHWSKPASLPLLLSVLCVETSRGQSLPAAGSAFRPNTATALSSTGLMAGRKPGNLPTTRAVADITVTGKVVDAQGGGLPGVSISVKGTTRGTTSNVDGTFQLTVTGPEEVLVFSFIGYVTQEIPVGTQTVINVTMAEDNQTLNEVVVVGYGTQRKRDVTGSIARVQGDEIIKYPVQTPTQAIQSKMAGVQIIASGQPNSQPQIRVAGYRLGPGRRESAVCSRRGADR